MREGAERGSSKRYTVELAVKFVPLSLAAALLTTSIAIAEPARREPPETVDGSTLVVFDGDTVALPGRERIRLLDIDTPETFDSRCERELMLGLKAKERLAELLRAGPVTIERRDKDRFGRTLAYLRLADDRDVGTVLLEESIALPYRPGKEASAARLAHWCGRAPSG